MFINLQHLYFIVAQLNSWFIKVMLVKNNLVKGIIASHLLLLPAWASAGDSQPLTNQQEQKTTEKTIILTENIAQ